MFLFLSDIHNEFGKFTPPSPSSISERIDAIIIAGDLNVRGAHVADLEEIWKIWRCPILFVPGNHEPYGSKFLHVYEEREAADLEAARARGADIRILRPGVEIIGDTRIIGATLWTPMDIDPKYRQLAFQQMTDHYVGMSDYRQIKIKKDGVKRRLDPRDTIAMHRRDFAFIEAEVAKPFAGKTIVVSHHQPVQETLDPYMRALPRLGDAAYTGNLWPEIAKMDIAAWISGHNHYQQDLTLEGEHGPITFLSNARGYPDQRTAFDPLRVLDPRRPELAMAPEYPVWPSRFKEWQAEEERRLARDASSSSMEP